MQAHASPVRFRTMICEDVMKTLLLLAGAVLLAGCAQTKTVPATPAATGASASATAATASCKSALALRSGQDAVFVLPVSQVAAAGGYEVFLNLKGDQWLCMTDAYNNVNRLEKR